MGNMVSDSGKREIPEENKCRGEISLFIQCTRLGRARATLSIRKTKRVVSETTHEKFNCSETAKCVSTQYFSTHVVIRVPKVALT